jgi:UDP:flavonoid glycosyltransferase YjiC (YdhE family)
VPGLSSTQFFSLGRLPYRHAVLRRGPRWLQAGLLAWGDRSANAMLLPGLNAMRQRYALPAVTRFRDWSFFRHPGVALYPAWYDDVLELAPLGIRQAGFVFAHDADGGPLPSTLQDFLDAGPPPMVVTFGTGVGHVASRFAAAVDLVRRTSWRAIFVSRFVANLPQQARSHPRIHVVAEADFAALLPRCAVLVHHGGIGTAAQAVRADPAGDRAHRLRPAGQRPAPADVAAGPPAIRAPVRRGRPGGAVADAIGRTDRARLRQLSDGLRADDGSWRAADVCEEVAAQHVGAARQTHE